MPTEDHHVMLEQLNNEIDQVVAENLQLKEELYALRLEEKEIRRQLGSMRG